MLQTTVGQFTIVLPDITSTSGIIPIKLTLESGSTMYLEMLINGKITVQNLVCFPDNAVRAHNFSMTGNLEEPVVILLEKSEGSTQLHASEVEDLNVASISILHQPMLGEEVILVARINGKIRSKTFLHYFF